jgi:hypothetical protein
MTPAPTPLFYAKTGKADEFKTAVNGLVDFVNEFANTYGLKVDLEESILIDVIRLYSRDIDKMSILDNVNPSAYRQAAALCIWLARLKPIVICTLECYPKASKDRIQQVKSQINEMFAMFAAFSVLLADHINTGKKAGMIDLVKGLWSPAYDDLLSVLRYRVVSRHAIAILLQAICEGGLKAPE